ncbi:Neural proliferation differentiation and control protein 1-like protein [Dinothrombium tinctorium]|uniref:Neural proliferation differentiation and control protein 1-like protein n=1 Tax=Dinothrombium tinctorium TaxID=1965070 RepID=A0A3S3NM10_9ACAR|nr:Neural proliferation differentiation and control protein 1-like protein [Dinothrombium tinctorium]
MSPFYSYSFWLPNVRCQQRYVFNAKPASSYRSNPQQGSGGISISPVFYRRSSSFNNELIAENNNNRYRHINLYRDNDDDIGLLAPQVVSSHNLAIKNDDEDETRSSDERKERALNDILKEDRTLDEQFISSTKQSDENRFKMKKDFDSSGERPNYGMLQTSNLEADETKRSPIQNEIADFVRGKSTFGDVYFVAIVAGCSAAAIIGVIGAGYCFYRFQQHSKAAADVDYPAYGVVGPATKENASTNGLSPSGDRKLAQSAQMYHYHHQKQQMIASEKAVTSRHTSASDVDSDEENEEGDYTVYECPGLAATGEMEVKNPLFQDDVTPVSSPPVVGNSKEK